MVVANTLTISAQADWWIAVVDDDKSIRQALKHALETGDLRCKAYGCAESLLDDTRSTAFACFVIDLDLPGMGGLALVDALRGSESYAPVVIISGRARVADVIAAFRCNVVGFLEKPFDLELLRETVDSVAKAFIERRAKQTRVRTILSKLSTRERQVMDGLMAGEKTEQVARRLSISQSTVEKHRIRIFQKTGMDSVIELIHFVRAAESETPAPISLAAGCFMR